MFCFCPGVSQSDLLDDTKGNRGGVQFNQVNVSFEVIFPWVSVDFLFLVTTVDGCIFIGGGQCVLCLSELFVSAEEAVRKSQEIIGKSRFDDNISNYLKR